MFLATQDYRLIILLMAYGMWHMTSFHMKLRLSLFIKKTLKDSELLSERRGVMILCQSFMHVSYLIDTPEVWKKSLSFSEEQRKLKCKSYT